MAVKVCLLCAVWLASTAGQRPGFAGSKPIGYPDVYNRTTTVAAELGDRFGEGDATTQRLPIEAKGDRDLVDRLSKLPVDQQPFWFINWQALEANRKNPQTYPQKPNNFIDTLSKSGSNNSNGIPNSNTLSSTTESSKSNTEANQPANSGTFNSTTEIKNRFSESENTSTSTTEFKNVGATENSPRTRLPTHMVLRRPTLATKNFRPKNPIID